MSRASDGGAKRSTATRWDKVGNIDGVNCDDGTFLNYYFETPRKPKYAVSPTEGVIEFIYDASERLIGKKRFDIQLGGKLPTLGELQGMIEKCDRTISNLTILDINGHARFEVTVKKVLSANGEVYQGNVTEHQYNLGKRIATIQRATCMTGDQLQNLDYNKLVKLTCEMNHPDDRITRSVFDLDGNQVRKWVKVSVDVETGIASGYFELYSYDALGRQTNKDILLEKLPFTDNNEVDFANLKKLSTRYWYDAAGRKVAELDPDNYLISYQYDAKGQLAQKCQHADPRPNIDRNASSIIIPDANKSDRVFTYGYDDLGRKIRTTQPYAGIEKRTVYSNNDLLVTSIVTDLKTGKLRKTKKQFNEFGELIAKASARVCALNAPENNTRNWFKQIYHPVTGLLLQEIDELGHKKLYFYGANRKPVLVIDAIGAVTATQYDILTGRPVEIYRYSNVLKAEILRGLQDDTLRTGYYDADSISKLLPDKNDKDRQWKATYNSDGKLSSKKKENGGKEKCFYNAFNETAKSLIEIEKDTYLETLISHDLRGNENKVITDPTGLAIERSEEHDDPLNRKTSTTTPSGYKEMVEYEGLRKATTKDAQDESRKKVEMTDAYMRPLSQSDWCNSNATRHEYVDSERRHTVINPVSEDRNIVESKNGFGEVESVIVNGKETTTKHGVDGQIEAVKYPDGSSIGTGYDLCGNKESTTSQLGLESDYVTDEVGNLTDQIDHINDRELVTHSEPDAFGDIRSQKDAAGLQIKHVIENHGLSNIEIRDPENLKLTKKRILNFLNQVIRITKGDKSNLATYQEVIVRDLLGNEKTRKIDLGNDKFATLLDTAYDESGNAISITDGNSNVTYHKFDNRGNKTFTLDPLGFVTEYIYDANNRLVEEKHYAKAVADKRPEVFSQPIPESETDFVIHYIRDADGLPKVEIRGTAAIEYKYNGAKKIVDQIEFALPVDLVATPLDKIPELLSTKEYQGHPLNRCAHNDYDAMNRVMIHRDAEGYETHFQYDLAGNEVVRSQNKERYFYTVYDKFGNIRYEIDAKGYIKEQVYNDVHACTHEIYYSRPLSEVLSNVELSKLTELLRVSGHLRESDLILENLQAACKSISSQVHDVINTNILDAAYRVKGTVDGEDKTEEYTLNGLDQVVEKKDGRKNKWVHQFNAANKLEKSFTPPVKVTEVRFDEEKQSLTETTLPEKKIECEYGYDGAFNQTSAKQAANFENDKREVNSKFDARNQSSGAKVENALVATHEESQSKDIETVVIRDYAGREIVNVLLNGGIEFTVYDINGREKFKVDAGGYVTEYQYEHAFKEYTKVIRYYRPMNPEALKSRLEGLTMQDVENHCQTAKSKLDRSQTFTYDRKGNKKSVTKDEAYTAKAIASEGKEGVVLVKKFARKTCFDYNGYGECTAERRKKMDGVSEATTQRFYDLNGNEYLTVSPQGYVTFRTFIMSNLSGDGGKYLEKSSIQYFNAVKAENRWSAEAIIQSIVPDELNDRRINRKFDKRHLCIETTMADGHPFFNTYRDEDKHLATRQENPDVTTKTEYDACGKPIVFTNAYNEKQYLIRDAIGNVKWKIGFPVKLSETEEVMPVIQYFYNAHNQEIGSRVYAMPGNLQFDDKNNIILDGLVTPTDMDEKTLRLMCNRGLPIITQSGSKGLTQAGFNEMRQKVKEQHFTTVSDINHEGKPVKLKVMREQLWGRNLRGDLILDAMIDEFERNESHYLVNAFGERTDEGPAFGHYCIHHRYDNAGMKWLSNGDRVIATISFSDEGEAEVVTYRSPEIDLLEKYMAEEDETLNLDKAVADLANVNHEEIFTEIQRFVTYRNDDEQCIRQDTPWYNQLPPFEPENYPVAFTVVADQKPDSTNYLLRFNAPDEVFLKMEFRIRLKGATEWDPTPLTVNRVNIGDDNHQYCEIDLGDRQADAYEYKLDFFHTEMKNDELVQDRFPCYRSVGDVMLDTGHYEHSVNPIWYKENGSILVIVGNASDIYGVELFKDSAPFMRIAGTRSSDGKLRIDLTHVECQNYSFKYLRGCTALSEGLTPGQDGEITANVYSPTFRFDNASSITSINNSLPQAILNKLHYSTSPSTQPIPSGTHFPGDSYDIKPVSFYWGRPIPSAYIGVTDAFGVNRFQQHITLNGECRFGRKPDMNSIFHYPMETVPANPFAGLAPNITSSMLVINKPKNVSIDAVNVLVNNRVVATYQLTVIDDYTLLALTEHTFSNLPAGATLAPITLTDSKQSEEVSTLTIGGKGKQLFQTEEISLSQFQIEQYSVGGYFKDNRTHECWDYYFAYEWVSSLQGNYTLRVSHNGFSGDIADISSLPRMNGGHRQYFQHLRQYHDAADPGDMSVTIIRDGVSIPMAHAIAQHGTLLGGSEEKIVDYDIKRYQIYSSIRAKALKHYDYDNMHVLYIKELPEGTDNAVFEYCFTSNQNKKIWRKVDCQMGYSNNIANGLSVFTNSMQPGNYECRVLLCKGNEFIKVSDPRYRQDVNGYCYLSVNITKRETQYGQVFVNQPVVTKPEIVKPFRLVDPDRWRNARSVTSRKGVTVKSDFNIYNQNIRNTTPPAISTNADGTDNAPGELITQTQINKLANKVAEVDAGDDSKIFLPNQRGKNLCEEDADGVQVDHEYDLFDRCVSSHSLAFGIIRSSFKRVDSLLVETRTYPNRTTEEITYNEDMQVIRHADRLADKNKDDDASHMHPDRKGNNRVTILPKLLRDPAKHPVIRQKFHPRSNVMLAMEDAEGGKQIWDFDGASKADAYVGNIARHTDLDGQVIVYTLNYNKQVTCELGRINGEKRKDLIHLLDEAGRETYLIDNGAQLTTRKRHDEEDFCTEYYFLGKDGRVYQATYTTYDELDRIHKVCDTHILIEFRYDKKSNRRCAIASVLGEDGNAKPFIRESWYDYSPAGRVRFRDCVMNEFNKIALSTTQGMEVTYKEKDGRVDSQKTLTSDGKTRTVKPIYGTGSAIKGMTTQIEGKKPKEETREPDVADRMITRTVIDHEKGSTVKETFELDKDDAILSQTTSSTTTDDKGKTHEVVTVRTVESRSALKVVEWVVTTLKDVAHDVVKDIDIIVTDRVTTTYRPGNPNTPAAVSTERLPSVKGGTGNDKDNQIKIEDYAKTVKEEKLVSTVDTNGAVIGIGPEAPISDGVFEDGYRSFVVNSEGCYQLKETNKGREYYFYAQKRPGKVTLMSYFGDLTDEVRDFRDQYTPKNINIDINHQPFSSSFPPPYPGKCTADGVKTIAEIAEEMNYSGYAEAIAWANDADIDTVPAANTTIRIPTLVYEVPETAMNGSLPAIEMLLGSMYPAISMPKISIHPPKVNWGLIAVEMAVGAVMSSVTMGALGPFIAAHITSEIAAAAITYALAGAAANAATQGVAIAAGEQHHFNAKAFGAQTLASAVTGGVLAGTGADPTKAAQHAFEWGDLAKNLATNEAIAAGQQALLMAAGLQSKPDYMGFATAGVNAIADIGVRAGFGSGTISTGLYTGITLAGNSAIRGQRPDPNVISASMVGAMVGSYVGQEAHDYIVEHRLDLQSWLTARTREVPVASASSNVATRVVATDKRRSKVSAMGAKKPINVIKRASNAEPFADDTWIADEYARTRGYGYARNKAAFWNSRSQQPQPSAQIPGPSHSVVHDITEHLDHMGALETVAIVAAGTVVGIFLLPEAIVSAVGTAAATTLTAAGTVATASMASFGVPIGEILIMDSMASATIGMAMNGGAAAYAAEKGLSQVTKIGTSVSESSGMLATESTIQVATKHPLAGLSPENVVRLVDELGLETQRDQLILWSGLGRDGVELSQNFAHANGGVTLEMTAGGKWLDEMGLFGPSSPFTKDEALLIWDRVSTKMIQQASGQVRSVVGQVRPASIYRAEQAEILMNKNITGLDELFLRPRYSFGK